MNVHNVERFRMKKTLLFASALLLAMLIPLGTTLVLARQTASRNIPASVKAVFSGAETITLQHRDLSPADIAAIETASGKPWSGAKDFHLYLAIGTTQGKRALVGAATVLENLAGVGDLTIAYGNDLKVTKVIAAQQSSDATSSAFLDQFAGKSHDDPIKLGQDVKYSGSNRATAAAVTDAVRRATATMQHLYGKAH